MGDGDVNQHLLLQTSSVMNPKIFDSLDFTVL
jgi:hypothetical protein